MSTSRSSSLLLHGASLRDRQRRGARRNAERVGRLLAEGGATVVTGGLGEVMAAAVARSQGGGRNDDRDPAGRDADGRERVARPRRRDRHRPRAQPRGRRVGRCRDRRRRPLRNAGGDRLRAHARAAGRRARAGLAGGRTQRAATPAEAVEFALAAARHTGSHDARAAPQPRLPSPQRAARRRSRSSSTGS